MLKAHVDHGFQLIKNDTSGFKSEDDYVDYLVELTRAGLEQRTQETAPMIEATPAFGGLLDLQIGWNADSGEAVSVEFNRQTNNYLAVTGKPGSGKTQFVKDLLARICFAVYRHGADKRGKVSHLKVRQFWREKGTKVI